MSLIKCTNKVTDMQAILEEYVDQANEIIAFSQRETALNASRFVQILVLGWLEKADASLKDLAEMAQEMGITVTDSAIHERINTKAVELLNHVLYQALHRLPTHAQISVGQLTQFTAIRITDSTQLCLPKSLYDVFAGPKGLAKAKLQVTLDYLSGDWVALEIESAKSPDQNSDLPVLQAIAGSLNLFDLGYFKQERLRDIDALGAFFVSRYQSQTAVYDVETDKPIDLVQLLVAAKTDTVDMPVKLGGRVRLPVRLVARRLPQAVADARRRKARKKMRENGKTCSQAYLTLLSWDILITNLSQETWSLNQLFDLYGIRMQIEWCFRVWKSELQVGLFGKNWRPERVMCQLYAHLIGILICHRLTAGWLWRNGQEHSFAKCVQIIQRRITHLMTCIKRSWHGIHAWIHRLEDSFQCFGCKTKRKKEPSTLQIFIQWGLS